MAGQPFRSIGKTLIQKTRTLIERKENWTKGAFARNFGGYVVESASNDAVCWCVSGALRRVFAQEDAEAKTDKMYEKNNVFEQLNEVIKEGTKGVFGMISAFNDDSKTTHEDVLRVFDRVIEKYERRDGI